LIIIFSFYFMDFYLILKPEIMKKFPCSGSDVLIFILVIVYSLVFNAGNKAFSQVNLKDSTTTPYCVPQMDAEDYLYMILKKPVPVKCDTDMNHSLGPFLSPFPYPGYALVTGYLVGFATNISFYTYHSDSAKISSLLFDNAYTQLHQLFSILNSNIFTKQETFNFLGDWRFYQFPTTTYGLGSKTTFADATSVDYNYLRFYEAAMRAVNNNFFAGIGYNIDYHYNIKEIKVPGADETDIEKYTFVNGNNTIGNKTLSSGVSINLQYDSRLNSNNPKGGAYANLKIRDNIIALGSNSNWQSLLLDARKYFLTNKNSGNVLAFWNYDWLTLGGKPPYFDLPTIGSDAYDNTGRAYVEGRFKGLNMLYNEVEYRFRILNNGLLGGVVFINASAFTNYPSNKFDKVNPGYGLGLRIKLNKSSDTNLCFDYAIGTGGSSGFAFNLNEVF